MDKCEIFEKLTPLVLAISPAIRYEIALIGTKFLFILHSNSN